MSTLKIIAGNGQLNFAGYNTTVPLTVQATDADGHPIVGLSLNWNVTNGQGTIVYPPAVTDANGQAAALFRGDVPPGYSFAQQTVTVSSSIGSVDFVETFGVSRQANGSIASLPQGQYMAPPIDNMTLKGVAGAILPAAVSVQVYCTSGPQSGVLIPNIEFHMVDGMDHNLLAAVQCVTPGITGTDGVATCDIKLPDVPGSYMISAKVGEAQVLPAIFVTVTEAPPPPPPPPVVVPVISAITNAASFAVGPVSPGEIVTLFGSIGPSLAAGLVLDAQGRVSTTLVDTQVLFDNTAAPLIYVSANQVSAVVPYDVNISRQVRVVYRGVKSAPLTVSITPSAPGIFTFNASGSGPAAALNQDNSVNTVINGAEPGSIVVLYLTGEGQTVPAGIDGQPALSNLPKPILPVSVKLGGVPSEVLYAGAAPQYVAGLMQVNVRLPGFPHGAVVPVTVTIGSNDSQAGVTIFVK